MGAVKLHPDFGPVKLRAAEVPGGVVGNIAAVVDLMRTAGTDRSRTAYKAFCAAYRSMAGSPLSDNERGLAAINEAMAETIRVHGPTPDISYD